MPIAFSPVSSWLGQNTFTAEPTGESLLQYSPQTLAQFTAGVPHFDPASIRHAPVPLQTQSTPEQAARAGQVSPASLVGGAPAGLPFSAQVGIGTGPGAGAGAVPMGQTAGAGIGGVGPTSTGPYGWYGGGTGGQETGSGRPGYSWVIANMLQSLQGLGGGNPAGGPGGGAGVDVTQGMGPGGPDSGPDSAWA